MARFFQSDDIINCFNLYGMKECDVLLPNLRYKNDSVYYYSKNPLKINKNNRVEYINEILLEDLVLEATVYYSDTEIKCKILKKEDENGLIVNIRFRDRHDISNRHIQMFARYIEASILKINIEDEYPQEEYYEEEFEDEFSEDNHSSIDDDELLYDEENEDINYEEHNICKKYEI